MSVKNKRRNGMEKNERKKKKEKERVETSWEVGRASEREPGVEKCDAEMAFRIVKFCKRPRNGDSGSAS